MKIYRSRNPHIDLESAYILINITIFPLLLIAGTIVRGASAGDCVKWLPEQDGSLKALWRARRKEAG